MKISKKTTNRYRVEVACEDIIDLLVAKLGLIKCAMPTIKIHQSKTPEVAVVVTWEVEE